jgi:SAM-dependent methyltransferase
MELKDHWEQVYSTRMAEKLGWYKPRLDCSLDWLAELGLGELDPIIDVGGGASTFVDDLVDEGFESITVLDIAESALGISKKRLGRQAELVMWICGDATTYRLPERRFALWHDRATFHFLTTPEGQAAYRDNLRRALRPGGYAIIGTFSPEAPPKCSGLPVQRYDAEHLASFLGSQLALISEKKELHVTPGGVEQMYQFCLFRREETG